MSNFTIDGWIYLIHWKQEKQAVSVSSVCKLAADGKIVLVRQIVIRANHLCFYFCTTRHGDFVEVGLGEVTFHNADDTTETHKCFMGKARATVSGNYVLAGGVVYKRNVTEGKITWSEDSVVYVDSCYGVERSPVEDAFVLYHYNNKSRKRHRVWSASNTPKIHYLGTTSDRYYQANGELKHEQRPFFETMAPWGEFVVLHHPQHFDYISGAVLEIQRVTERHPDRYQDFARNLGFKKLVTFIQKSLSKKTGVADALKESFDALVPDQVFPLDILREIMFLLAEMEFFTGKCYPGLQYHTPLRAAIQVFVS